MKTTRWRNVFSMYYWLILSKIIISIMRFCPLSSCPVIAVTMNNQNANTQEVFYFFKLARWCGDGFRTFEHGVTFNRFIFYMLFDFNDAFSWVIVGLRRRFVDMGTGGWKNFLYTLISFITGCTKAKTKVLTCHQRMLFSVLVILKYFIVLCLNEVFLSRVTEN